jgi:hypothetical protein
LRDGRIDIYAVNEHGGQAVLVTALVRPAIPPPDRVPIPLAGLLLVVAPGFELAMSVLTVEASNGPPIAGLPAGTASGNVTPALEEGAGSQQTESDKGGQPGGDKSDDEAPLRDAAILDLLMGVQDALTLRPPKLQWDEHSADGRPDEPAAAPAGAVWLAQSLRWIWNVDWSGVVELLPLPPGMGVVADAALAALREWFQSLAPDSAVALPAAADAGTATVASATDELLATGAWTVDPWLAAIALVGLAGGDWASERRPPKCCEIRPRRARFPGRPRPCC